VIAHKAIDRSAGGIRIGPECARYQPFIDQHRAFYGLHQWQIADTAGKERLRPPAEARFNAEALDLPVSLEADENRRFPVIDPADRFSHTAANHEGLIESKSAVLGIVRWPVSPQSRR
jgi:hypothetical protein